ncbi:hypothetical protein [Streptomyces sp. NPDC050416]|uniref:hypothetical protein n=1 Tax=Streptomyces sp. NPDC050416 TaxID=3365611 RepID=UPI003794E001
MQLAADRQANALIHTVQETLNDQQVARRLAQRQQAFVEFFRAAEAMRWAQVTNAEERAVRLRDLRQAYLLLQLELFPDEAAGHDVFRELQRLVWDARNPGGSEEMEELYEHSRDRVIELAFQALQRTQSSSHPR